MAGPIETEEGLPLPIQEEEGNPQDTRPTLSPPATLATVELEGEGIYLPHMFPPGFAAVRYSVLHPESAHGTRIPYYAMSPYRQNQGQDAVELETETQSPYSLLQAPRMEPPLRAPPGLLQEPRMEPPAARPNLREPMPPRMPVPTVPRMRTPQTASLRGPQIPLPRRPANLQMTTAPAQHPAQGAHPPPPAASQAQAAGARHSSCHGHRHLGEESARLLLLQVTQALHQSLRRTERLLILLIFLLISLIILVMLFILIKP